MRLFQIDYDRLVVLLLPTFLRLRFTFELLRALIEPVVSLKTAFDKNRADNLYLMRHNGQVCYLRAVLNDVFDTELRRIRIDDVERNDWIYIYKESEDHPLWLETKVISQEAYTTEGGSNFVVIVPLALGFDIKPRMISLINFYKLAGKQYSIQYE